MRSRATNQPSAHLGVVHLRVLTFIVVLLTANTAWPQATYRFERSWPAMQQFWSFKEPDFVATDPAGNVYVADSANHLIHKFTADGVFINKWGSDEGDANGQFKSPEGIALDTAGNVYVVDSGNNRIQKFTADGRFISKWPTPGVGDMQFNSPKGIAIDGFDNVYVVDQGNNRVQKFTADLVFIRTWGTQGAADGQFQSPAGIVVDTGGRICVADTGNHRIQRFTADGVPIDKWGTYGDGDGQFNKPFGIASDRSGNLYVVEQSNVRVQKFTGDFSFITKWGTYGMDDDQFDRPHGIAVDGFGNVYVADTDHDRIQKFTDDGGFITNWGNGGAFDGRFTNPMGIAVDTGGNVYVADSSNNRIQRFSPEGVFIDKWGSYGDGNDQFDTPYGVAVARSGMIYVADSVNNRIQRFSADGKPIPSWGGAGSGPKQFNDPCGVAVDTDGNVYVADTNNHRIQKLDEQGSFIREWGGFGVGEGQFSNPVGIATDSSGNVYVADTINNRIQKFTSDGDFITLWGNSEEGDNQLDTPMAIAVDAAGDVYVTDTGTDRIMKYTADGEFIMEWGETGSNPGQFGSPFGIAVSASGQVYVIDYQHNRIEAFRQTGAAANNRAIIVAGGGPYPGNHLWDATQMCANFAYRALTYQGFTKETIYYLSSNTKLDLDSNGVLDDVDGDATNERLHYAVTEWARGAENVAIYLVDHGGAGTFRMRSKENLAAADLGAWLNALQASISGKVILIYDACQSGSFLETLASTQGPGRIVVASTSPEEKAYFLSQGALSFSNYFWTQIFNGLDIFNAFKVAQEAVVYTTGSYPDPQHPLLDDNGNGVGNDGGDGAVAGNTFIGSGTNNFLKAPTITGFSPDQVIGGTSTATLYADLAAASLKDIARVWAVIRPPGYMPGSSGNPVSELPWVDLRPVQAGSTHFEASYAGFTQEGTYPIAIYAMNRSGYTCVPKVTNVSVVSPLTRKAIIVAGVSAARDINAGIEQATRTAYTTLSYQGYGDDDIMVLASDAIPGVDHGFQAATLANLQDAIGGWAAGNTQDVVLYLVGEGERGAFKLNGAEKLAAADLGGWLDTLQASVTGKVVVVYDASHAGSFLSELAPPQGKKRILLSSSAADQSACFASEGFISFSQYFWPRVANGATVLQAFLDGRNALRSTCPGQAPQLDDNGNGIGNEDGDTGLARYYAIGMGMMIAADPAVIGTTCSEITLSKSISAPLWVRDVISSKPVEKVFAAITPPGYDANPATQATIDTVELAGTGDGQYTGTYKNFSKSGTYAVSFFALDSEGNVSYPKTIGVTQTMTTADIVVTKVTGPTSATRGQSISVTATATNQGVRAVGAFALGIYLSTDNKIKPDQDRLLKTITVKKLNPGKTSNIKTKLAIPGDVQPGTYSLGAVADIYNSAAEANEGNNAKAAKSKLVVR